MAGTSIGSLFVQLGFKSDKTKLNDFIKSIGELDMRSIVAGLGLKGIQEAIEKIMGSASGAAKDMTIFGKATGLSTKKMQQFGNFAEQMGVSSDEAMSSVKGLQDSLTKIRMGEGNIRPFALLGVSVTKDVWSTLDQLHKKMLDPRIPDAIKKTMIAEMGLSESMMAVLKASDAEWDSIKDQMYMTESQIAGVHRYNKAIAKFVQAWKQGLQDVAAFLAPMIERATELVTQFFLLFHHSQKFREQLLKWSPLIAGIMMRLNPVLGAVMAIGSGFAIWHKWGEKIKATLTPIIDKILQLKEIIGKGLFSFGGQMQVAHDRIMSNIAPNLKNYGGYGGTNRSQTNHVTYNITGSDAKEIADKVAEKQWWNNLGNAQFQDAAFT